MPGASMVSDDTRNAGKIAALTARVDELEDRVRVAEDAPVEVGAGGGDEESSTLPFQVYLAGGYVCVRPGHHLWWNAYTSQVEGASTELDKDEADAWVAAASATVIYLKRVYNSDGTATVTLENANTDFASVMAGVTTTEARWILATLSGGGIQRQWWTGGDIYELRVA